jgi:hypothetical protein
MASIAQNVTITIIHLRYPQILIVSTGCLEARGKFNPPPRLYHMVHLKCNLSTNHIDAREVGQLLRFAYQYYDLISEKKIIVIHAHDRSGHYRGNIWDEIQHLVSTDYFWKEDFGVIIRRPTPVLFTKFNTSGPVLNSISYPFQVYPDVGRVMQFCFRRTSIENYSFNETWEVPRSSTFFMNSILLKTRKRDDYKIMLQNVNDLVTEGICELLQWVKCPIPRWFYNAAVGYVWERAWAFIFTNKGIHKFMSK